MRQFRKYAGLIFTAIFLLTCFGCDSSKPVYETAKQFMDEGKYDSALDVLLELDGYKDSNELVKECYYNLAIEELNADEYLSAYNDFVNADDYADANEYASNLIVPEQIMDSFKETFPNATISSNGPHDFYVSLTMDGKTYKGTVEIDSYGDSESGYTFFATTAVDCDQPLDKSSDWAYYFAMSAMITGKLISVWNPEYDWETGMQLVEDKLEEIVMQGTNYGSVAELSDGEYNFHIFADDSGYWINCVTPSKMVP